MEDYAKKVLNLISDSKEPLSIIEIARQLSMSQATVYRSIKRLIEDNDIIEISGKNKKFYIPNKGTTYDDLSNMNQIMMTLYQMA